MATAGDVITLLRLQLNDNVTPYRHSDAELRRWLSDGQRLIVQLKPESNPATAAFTPVTGAVRQRLNMADAHALIRVEQNLSYQPTTLPEPGWSFAPIRHLPDDGALINEYDFITLSPDATFPISGQSGLRPTAWTTAQYPAFIFSFAIDHLAPITNLGVTYAGVAMDIVSETRTYAGDDLVTKYLTVGTAIIALDADNPPVSTALNITGTGTYSTFYALYGTFTNVDVPATVAGWAGTQYENTTAANGYSIGIGPIPVANGDMLITMLFIDWTEFFITNEPIRAPEQWYSIVPPAYTTNYSFMAVTNGDHNITVGGNTRRPYGLNLISHVASPTTSFSDTFHYAFTSLSVFPVEQQGDVPSGSIGASFLPAYSRVVRIVAKQNAVIEGPPVETRGTIIRSVDRDVYDTFDVDWMSRTPDPLPDSGAYFDGFCFDPDDPLGFFLHPKPTDSGDRVVVTYAAVPPELTSNSTQLALSDMYVDPLCNYTAYRAMSAQTQGYSDVGAARAIERFGQQLNLSRETIAALIGAPHRQVEQQQ